jgi:hypothetical protein
VRRDLYPKPAARLGLGGPDRCAVEPGEGHRPRAAREADLLDDIGHRARAGELPALPGNEDHALSGADVDGERERHAREDDRVVHGHQQQGFHVRSLHQ